MIRFFPDSLTRLAATICLALTTLPAGAQTAPVPATSTQEPPPAATTPGVTVELMESVYRLENDGTGVRTQDARVRVRTDAGLAPLGRLVFVYDSTIERLTVDVVEVIKPDGRVVQPGPEASNDVTPEALAASALYSGHRQRHVVVAGLAVNDSLHYRVTVRSVRALLPGHFWLGVRLMKDTPVTTERVTIDVPAARDVRLKTSPDAAPVVAGRSERRPAGVPLVLQQSDPSGRLGCARGRRGGPPASAGDPTLHLLVLERSRAQLSAGDRRPERRRRDDTRQGARAHSWPRDAARNSRRSTPTSPPSAATSLSPSARASSSRTPPQRCCGTSTETAKTVTSCWPHSRLRSASRPTAPSCRSARPSIPSCHRWASSTT